jgi:2-polyprenyl-3-methyl-5-hydroxy-6-metoxy-1,4-benzoquinol methylase
MNADHGHWARIAPEWVAWARTPNHDAFWAYRASLLTFIGRGKGEALDVGCGEGRVSRVLKDCGYRVTATDPVEASRFRTLVRRGPIWNGGGGFPCFFG